MDSSGYLSQGSHNVLGQGSEPRVEVVDFCPEGLHSELIGVGAVITFISSGHRKTREQNQTWRSNRKQREPTSEVSTSLEDNNSENQPNTSLKVLWPAYNRPSEPKRQQTGNN